jgi:hypothetical protein
MVDRICRSWQKVAPVSLVDLLIGVLTEVVMQGQLLALLGGCTGGNVYMELLSHAA